MTNEEYVAKMRKEGFFAFPCVIDMPDGGELKCAGLSVRDYIAIAAIPAAVDQSHNEPFQEASDLAKWLYEFADAMLAERAKQ